MRRFSSSINIAFSGGLAAGTWDRAWLPGRKLVRRASPLSAAGVRSDFAFAVH
jgi:hypothetical protein